MAVDPDKLDKLADLLVAQAPELTDAQADRIRAALSRRVETPEPEPAK